MDETWFLRSPGAETATPDMPSRLGGGGEYPGMTTYVNGRWPVEVDQRQDGGDGKDDRCWRS